MRKQRRILLLTAICGALLSSALSTALARPLTVALSKPQQLLANTNASKLSPQDEAFLEDLSKRLFRFFWENADPNTGLVLDRIRTDGSPPDATHRDVASIAATGFGLTALCIAAERGWINSTEARKRVHSSLQFLADRMPSHNGWFYHFVNRKTGERVWKSELSSIDTALLMAGVLTVRQYYRSDAEIYSYATRIYQRIDFPWMLNNHTTLLSMGWRPENGWINSRWDNYSEHTMLYLMAIGSPSHPINARSWYAWKRDWNHYKRYKYLGTAPLFTHQYSHAWIDYRGRRETRGSHVDYFENSVIATRAHREFCLDLAVKFPGYSENVWGISASDSATGYRAWGGPPATPDIDGTVVPNAPGGSLMFTPDISVPALRAMHQQFGERIYGRYGFADAFNPNTGWVDTDVIGIDVGIMLLSAENLKTGNVWRWFMRNGEIERAMQMVGLRKYGERGSRAKWQSGKGKGVNRKTCESCRRRSADCSDPFYNAVARVRQNPADGSRRIVQILSTTHGPRGSRSAFLLVERI